MLKKNRHQNIRQLTATKDFLYSLMKEMPHFILRIM